jgi:hypothetical protein
MKPMLALLVLFVAAMLFAIFAGSSYSEGVARVAGYVATLALGGMVALLVQVWKNRRPGARRPR